MPAMLGSMHAAAERVIGLYQRHAQRYLADRGATPWIEGAWLDRFAALLEPGAAVLDIGCGGATPIAAYLLGRGFAVDGVDASPALIAHARTRFPQRDWQVADMRSLALGRRYRGLLAWDSFFHLGHDDQRRMFAVFDAHAGADAVLLFTSGPAHGEALGRYAGETLYHASLDAREYRALLATHGFQVVAHCAEDPDCGGHTVWLARRGRG